MNGYHFLKLILATSVQHKHPMEFKSGYFLHLIIMILNHYAKTMVRSKWGGEWHIPPPWSLLSIQGIHKNQRKYKSDWHIEGNKIQEVIADKFLLHYPLNMKLTNLVWCVQSKIHIHQHRSPQTGSLQLLFLHILRPVVMGKRIIYSWGNVNINGIISILLKEN